MSRTGARLEKYRCALVCAALLLAPLPALASDWAAFQFAGDLGGGFDDNVSNSVAGQSARQSGVVTSALHASTARLLSPNVRLQLRGTLRAEAITDYGDLSNAKLTGLARVFYRPDAGFFTPTLALTAAAAQWQFGSRIRDSVEYQLGFFLEQPVTTLVSSRLTLAATQRESASRVFDLAGQAVSLDLDWRANPRLTVYGGYQFRSGDIVSSAVIGGGSPADYAVTDRAEVIEADDAFGGFATGTFAYRLDADTQVGTLGLNRSFSRSLSVDLQVQSVRSDAGGGIHYDRLVGTASLLKRF